MNNLSKSIFRNPAWDEIIKHSANIINPAASAASTSGRNIFRPYDLPFQGKDCSCVVKKPVNLLPAFLMRVRNMSDEYNKFFLLEKFPLHRIGFSCIILNLKRWRSSSSSFRFEFNFT
jgi:hypothetical protein